MDHIISGEVDTMGLFGTVKVKKKATTTTVINLLEKNFNGRKLDLHAQGLEDCDGYGWWIKEGSIKVYIFIQDEPHGTVIRVTSPIVHFPNSNREPFFLRLLEINRDLHTCCLACFQEVVLVSAQRPVGGIDADELDFLVWNVARVADELDGKLAREVNCRPYQEH
ncbi:MAG: YbjN domain-containing protein [Candidatus Melainabacteria bacterium]|nr:YbjN domain-containing protein [Candidatus Melainabacteria bacterium]